MSMSPEGEFKDRVVLVTGGAGDGIGGHTAKRFAQLGAKVAIVDIHEPRTHKVAKALVDEVPGATVLPKPGDIADRARMDEVIAELEQEVGPVDVLVNNAAENVLAPVREYKPEDWDRVLDVDLTACFYLVRKVFPGMCERRRGSIVNVASIAGWLGDANEGREGPYACAKSALFALTRSVAFEGGPFGVRCNAVAPGLVWTKFVRKYRDQFEPEIDRTPLRKIGDPDDIVNAIEFLASDALSGFITGEAINVSGGWYMRP